MTDVTIDIMILITNAAWDWGNIHGGGILNCVATAVGIGNIVHANSQTGVTNRLVHHDIVYYTESDDPELDLIRLTLTSDGHMDYIHTWRNTYGADLVQLFTKMGGGIAWLLTNSSGDPAGGFSCVGVGYAKGFTSIHEMGHNMGCHHHKQQNFQPGPGLYSYSAGWRWLGSDGVLYSSTMSYSDGSFFPPNYQSSTQVGYFSNPTISFMGGATGDYIDADNAWTIEHTKSVIAAYRAPAANNCLGCPEFDFVISPANTWNTHASSINSNGCKTYSFKVSTGHTYTFQTGCGNGAANFDTYLNLIDSGCSDITFNNDGCESNRSKITWTATYNGYAYLKVSGYSADFGAFTLAYQKTDELIWTGAVSTNWNTSENWNENVVPDTTFDVTIPSGSFPQPYIQSENASCKSLTIDSGATLIIGGYSLNVQNDLNISGGLNMNNATGAITVYGNVSWNSGSTAAFSAYTAFNVYGTWVFNTGSNANLANGTVAFRGTSSRYIRCYSSTSSLNNVGSYKSGGAETGISSLSTQPLTINGDIYVHPGAKFNIASSHDLTLKGDINSNGTFLCNAGEIILDGVSQELRMNVGDYFKNLTFSQTGMVTINNSLSSILDVNGNVSIVSGVFNLSDRTMKVGGDWTNSAGSAAFTEGTSRVIFDGPGHQLVKSNETFNILEANMGEALRLEEPAGYTVTCNKYDWTTGGIDVVEGTFTALDLADNGLYGTFWCNPGGAINLTQDIDEFNDLNGEIHIFGGTMTVTGGLGMSFWPYANSAVIEMSGGILDFKDNGINIYNISYPLTENITGGTIRTNGNFKGSRADFTPSGGTIELYGSTDVQLNHGLGSNFYNLLINKSASKDNSGKIIEEKFYDRDGNLMDGSKANNVSAISNLILFGDMTIQNGKLIAPSSIKLKGDWTNNVGTAGFTEGTGTVTFNNNNHQYCYGEVFHALELNMAMMDLHIPAGTTTTCQIYDWNSGELEVEGGTFIAYDLFDNGIFGKYYLNVDGGLIELHQDNSQFVDLCGKITIVNGTMNVYGGNGYSYWPFSTNGAIWMSGGVLDFKDNGIQINSSALTLDDQITGGLIRMSKGFSGYRSDFTPTGGTFEFYGSGDYNISQSNGCTLSNVKINKSAKDGEGSTRNEPEFDTRSGMQISDGGKSNTITLSSDFTIAGDLEISAGTFNLNLFSCNVSGITDIYGTLSMTNAANDLSSGTINWNAGSNDNVTAGTFHAQNWRFNDGTNAKLGTGNTAYLYDLYYPSDNDAEFGNLVAKPFSKLSDDEKGSKAYFPIRVMGNFTAQPGADWYIQHEVADLLVAGNSTIENTAIVEFYLADFTNTGNLTLNGSLILGQNSIAIVDGDFVFAGSGILNVGTGTFTNNYSGAIASLAGMLQLTTGVVEFPNRNVSLFSTFDDQIYGGTMRFGRSFAATVAGTFQPNAGIVEFINPSAGNYVQVIGDNFLYDVMVNKPGSSLLVYDNLKIKGDLTINAGILNSNIKTITIAGDWNNNVGTSAFAETTGKVIFNGSMSQFCSTEDFYALEMNKPSELLYNTPYSTITCQVYDWTSGGIWISPGNFTAFELADNGLYGTFAIWNGTMNLYQDGSQFVDINCSIAIGSDGNMNIYGGTGDSWWGFDGNATVTMNGGTLDLKNASINIPDSPYFNFEENITEGTIRTPGFFIASDPGFTPTGGSVELYGGTTASLATGTGCNFYNLVINKSGGLKDDQLLKLKSRMGNTYPEGRANQAIMTGNVNVNGILQMNAGELYSGSNGYILTSLGNVNIESGSTLKLRANSKLKLNAALNVNSGGSFISQGDAGFEATVTRASTNNYTFNVNSGGQISADSTIFEYMGANGINVKTGAIVDLSNAFNYCTFRNGEPGQTLLIINNDQELTCTGAIFPANTWGGNSNVTKWVNQGRITFYDYFGGFSGPSFETDLFNRVDWFEPQLSASPLTLNVSPPAGSTTFFITSNVDWAISESISWAQVTPMAGSNNAIITVNFTQNSSTSARSGIITLSAPDVPNVIVTINQAGANLSVTPSSQSVSASIGSTSFNVASNTSWTVSETVLWLSVLPMSGTGNNTLVVNYNQNGSVTPRSGQITVSSPGIPSVVVTVNQAGVGVTLTVLPANRDVAAEAAATTFSLSSNTGWTVSESVSWLSVLPMSGTGNGTLAVNYGENATGSTRIGNINVTATGGSPSVNVTVTQISYPTHSVSLNAGWQGLSSYIMPMNNAIGDVFDPLLPDFIIAQTLTGVYYPAGPINTIYDWLSQSAYKVKMGAPSVLSIIGNEETNKVFGLNTGWNLVPVIVNTPVDVVATFSGTSLTIAKDVAGVGVYWPAMSINTLGNLLPGLSYYAMMSSPGSITFPANSKDAWTGYYPMANHPDHPWNKIGITPSSHLIAIEAEGMKNLQPGDVLGVFSAQGVCFGVTEIADISQNAIITAYADDPLTGTSDGFSEMELMSYRLYRSQTGEVFDVEVEYNPQLPQTGHFTGEGLSAIKMLKLTTTGMSSDISSFISIYPNPTDGTIWITGTSYFEKIELIGALGSVIKTISTDGQNNISIDLSAYQPGVYQVKISGDNGSVVKRVVKN